MEASIRRCAALTRSVAAMLLGSIACSEPTEPIQPVSALSELLFIRESWNPRSRAVHALDLETGSATRLTPTDQWVLSFELSADKRRFAYTVLDRHGLLVRAIDDTTVTPLATQFTGMDLPYFRWSPDGSQIAFQGGRYPHGDIGVVEVTTGVVTRLTADTVGSIDDADPDWAPDGSSIVWTHGSFYSGFTELWTMRADGSGKRRLVTPGGFGQHARWSPLGNRIAYDNQYGIFTIQPDGSHSVAVTPGCNSSTGICSREREFGYPVWSRDGRYLAALGRWSDGYDYVLSVMEANGESMRDVRGLIQHSNHDWSDDDVLAFTGAIPRPYQNVYETAEIFVTRPDLSDLRPLTNSDTRDEMPRWLR